MKYVIDRFEGAFAVLENQQSGEMENWAREKLPAPAQEGDTLELFDQTLVLVTDKQARRIAEKMKRLFRD